MKSYEKQFGKNLENLMNNNLEKTMKSYEKQFGKNLIKSYE